MELVAFAKLLTELAKLAASAAIAAICAEDGLAGSVLTALVSVFSDVVIALVSLGKSVLAELTSAFASLWTLASCDFRLLTSALEVGTVSPLVELSRALRSEQYAGLLLPLPQPAATVSTTAAISATGMSVGRLGAILFKTATSSTLPPSLLQNDVSRKLTCSVLRLAEEAA